MLKSIVWILFTVDVRWRDRKIPEEGGGEGRERERERKRLRRKISPPHGALQSPAGPSSPWSLVVGVLKLVFSGTTLYSLTPGYSWDMDAIPIN